jgi:diadenylate cyclase
MNFLSIINDLRVPDVLDILFLTVVAYHLHLWFKGTKALKALVGLFVLGIIFTFARNYGLFLTTWVFQILWQVLIIMLIILFQSEIRQALERVIPLRALGPRKNTTPGKWVSGFTSGIFSLARKKIGALVIIERWDLVEEWISGGIPLTGEPAPELLLSIFQKESPLHDGAVLIRGDQIVLASCYLPLSATEALPKEWGTRHRAALGVTEKCDACVIAVSEERGEVALAHGGELIRVENKEQLSRLVTKALTNNKPKKGWFKGIMSFTLGHWPYKVGSLLLVTLLWLLLAGQQDFEVTLSVPLKITNIPPNIEVLEPVKPVIQITARGIRKDASTLNDRNVYAKLDISMARVGRKFFPITREQIFLPNDRIQVIRIEPSQFGFKFKENQ